ncbi:condensation domain-containing protein [Streptomyces naphthomycinicus]|uniref:condensation domain-containing protein n=1 Tax=Streptomyces naphthomycinicus TaxID=2872625 RepID=UPI001CEDB829|nr:condensation domain-containing protein [Streptomyces sp. TML10]
MDDSLSRLTPQQWTRLAERVRAEQPPTSGKPARPAGPPVPRAHPAGPRPATHTQEQLWFLSRLTAGVPNYNVPFRFDLEGPLEPHHLHAALRAVVRRHDALRTELRPHPDGLRQVVLAEVPVELPVRDLSRHEDPRAAADARCFELARTVFDLGTAPLWRFELLRLDARGERHVLVWIASHTIADGGAVSVLLDEVGAAYAALAAGRDVGLPDPGPQLTDYAVRQRAALTPGETERLTAYWRRRLDGYDGLRLDYDRPSPAGALPAGRTVRFTVPPGLRRRAVDLARKHSGSPFMVLLAAYQVLLARLARRGDVATALPLACRDTPGFERVLGSLTNTVVIRTDTGDGACFATVLDRVREAVLGAMEHQDLPFGKLVEELRPARRGRTNPITETIFSYGGTPATLGWTPLGDSVRAGCRGMSNDTVRFDFELVLDDTPDGLTGRFEYDSDRIDAASAHRICDAYTGILRAALDRPEAPLPDLWGEESGRSLLPLPAWSAVPAGAQDAALPGGPAPGTGGAPRTEAERAVARIWSAALDRDALERDADFFALGGYSMLAVDVIAAVNEEFGTDLSVMQIFETSSVAALARAAENAAGAGGPGGADDAGGPGSPGSPRSPGGSGGPGGGPGAVAAELLDQVERMSDDEVARALERLRDTP